MDGGRNRIGLIVERIDERGWAFGRYCTHIIDDENGKHGGVGQMTLWDIQPDMFDGRVVGEHGNLEFHTMWWREGKLLKNRLKFWHDYGLLRLDYEVAGKLRLRGALHRGHYEHGCVHRTTARPVKATPAPEHENAGK